MVAMLTDYDLDEALGSIACDEDALTAQLCKERFYYFVQEFWDTINPGESPVWNWHIEFLCDELQGIAELVFNNQPKDYDLICNIPPGMTKSTIFSIMYCAWTWTFMPHARHICATHTEELGLDFSRKCRNIVESEKYQRLFPHIKLSKDQNTKHYFVNTLGGWRLIATIGGNCPTGYHAHFVNVDDPIDPMKVFSEAEIKQANDFMIYVLPTRKANKEVSVTTLVMQRLHQNDPSGNWIERERGHNTLKVIVLPGILTDDVSPKYLRDKYVDNKLDPIRLSDKVLVDYKRKGAFFFGGQILQNPVPLGGGMFKTAKLITEKKAPPLSEFKEIVRYWDNAATEGDGTYSVGVKMGIIAEKKDSRGTLLEYAKFWVLDVQRGQWSSDERERIKKQCAKSDGVKCRIGQEQEPGSGGKESAEATARRLYGYTVFKDRPTGDKTARADPYSTSVNEGAVYLVEADWNHEYIQEMMYFPESTYKDQVDASSGAYNALTRARPMVRGLSKRK